MDFWKIAPLALTISVNGCAGGPTRKERNDLAARLAACDVDRRNMERTMWRAWR